MMRRSAARIVPATITAGVLATCVAFAQLIPPAKSPPTEAQQKKAMASLSAPWPDADTLRQRRVTSENRRLFQPADPLAFTLLADFKAVGRDRDPNSTKSYPATLVVADEKGHDVLIQVQLRTRGSLRLMVTTCDSPPLRVVFPKSGLKNTVFAGEDSLKLVPHCNNNAPYEQYLLREFLAYKIFGLFTPRSYRVRLAKGSYLDAASGKPVASRYAFFVESNEDVARRMEGRIAEIKGQRFAGQDDDTLVLMAMLQWMVGNTDYSISALHNIRLVQLQDGLRYPIAYDFDSAGLVDAPYAGPDKRLGINTTRDRLFRGPCRPMEKYEVFLAKFREKKGELMALIDAVPGFTESSRKDARSYMEEFYSTISNPGRAKRAMLDSCVKSTRM